MDKFPGFKDDEEWTSLNVDSLKLEKIVSEILSEFSLELKELQKSTERDDRIAVAVNQMGEETKSLVRARSYIIGLTMEDVEDLYEDMLNLKATSAIFITSSHFTKDGKEFAEHAPIKLIDGTELGKLITKYTSPTAEFVFLSAFEDYQVVRYFKKCKSKKFLRLIGSCEKIEEIDKRYIPIGHFAVKKVTRDSEITNNIYVDLTSGSIFYMEKNTVQEDFFFKKILDLPEESQEHLLDLIKYGKLRYKHIEGKSLDILEKEKLISVDKEGKGKGVLGIVMDELTSTVSITTSEATTLTHPTPKEDETKIKTEKYVKEILSKPIMNAAYNIEHFIESMRGINPEFEPDPLHYDPEKVAYVLDNIYPKEDIYFVEMAYLPYYRCKYVKENGSTRFKKLFSPKFKKFVPRKTPLTGLFMVVDVVPALPYLLVGLAYIFMNQDNLSQVIHVFSTAFMFSVVAVITGLFIKIIAKTDRKMPRYGSSIVRYGFPSIHALGSAGAAAFAYFVDPMFALVLAPLSLLYVYSRLALGVHSETDIFGGVIIGVIVGVFFGSLVLPSLYFKPVIELVLAVMCFVVAVIATIFEQRLR